MVAVIEVIVLVLLFAAAVQPAAGGAAAADPRAAGRFARCGGGDSLRLSDLPASSGPGHPSGGGCRDGGGGGGDDAGGSPGRAAGPARTPRFGEWPAAPVAGAAPDGAKRPPVRAAGPDRHPVPASQQRTGRPRPAGPSAPPGTGRSRPDLRQARPGPVHPHRPAADGDDHGAGRAARPRASGAVAAGPGPARGGTRRRSQPGVQPCRPRPGGQRLAGASARGLAHRRDPGHPQGAAPGNRRAGQPRPGHDPPDHSPSGIPGRVGPRLPCRRPRQRLRRRPCRGARLPGRGPQHRRGRRRDPGRCHGAYPRRAHRHLHSPASRRESFRTVSASATPVP